MTKRGLHQSHDDEYAVFLEWWAKPKSVRVTQRVLAETLGLSTITINKWCKLKLEEEKTPEDDAQDMLETIRKYALEGKNPKYAELYAKITGLTDKKEDTKRELTADEYFSILSEADKRYGQLHRKPHRNKGEQSVPEVPAGEVCLHREQECGEESEVGSVAVPA